MRTIMKTGFFNVKEDSCSMADRQKNSFMRNKLTPDEIKILFHAAKHVLHTHPDPVMAGIIADGYAAILEGRFDHMDESGYLAPAEYLADERGVPNARVVLEYEYLKKMDEIEGISAQFPLTRRDDAGREYLISAQQMYEDTMQRPEYYRRWAVQELIAEHIEVFKRIHKTHFFVPFCGEGVEVIQLLRILWEQHGVAPNRVTPSDINRHSLNVTAQGIRQLYRGASVSCEVSEVCGNIFDEDFIRNNVFKKSDKDNGVIFIDPTYNNLKNKEVLLKNMYEESKSGTALIALVDVTCNLDKIAAAYSSPLSVRWILRSYLWMHRQMGFNFNLDPNINTITAGLYPQQREDGTGVDVLLNVTHAFRRNYPLMIGRQEYQLPFAGHIPAGNNAKMTEAVLMSQIKNAGWSTPDGGGIMRRKKAGMDDIRVIGAVCGKFPERVRGASFTP